MGIKKAISSLSAVFPLRHPAVTSILRGVAWTTGAAVVERSIGMVQAVYLAHLLGIELYGKQGLVFSTVGLVSSLSGLQLGLTASVYIARNKWKDPRGTADVVRLCEILCIVSASILLVLIALDPESSAAWLLKDSTHSDVVMVAASIAILSVVSGLQEGVLQGFEAFRALAMARTVVSIVGLGSVLAIARAGNLSSAVLAISLGLGLRAAILILLKERMMRERNLKASLKGAISRWRIIRDFSLPSVLAGSLGGLAAWYGLILLTKTTRGFEGIAVITVAQQWRGVVLYFATLTASVIIPTMSRLIGDGDQESVRKVHAINLYANVGLAALMALILGCLGPYILTAYGADFSAGYWVFCISLAATVPLLICNVYQQLLVAQSRMWTQLAFYVMHSLVLVLGYSSVVENYGSYGYVAVSLGAAFILATALALFMRRQTAMLSRDPVCEPENAR